MSKELNLQVEKKPEATIPAADVAETEGLKDDINEGLEKKLAPQEAQKEISEFENMILPPLLTDLMNAYKQSECNESDEIDFTSTEMKAFNKVAAKAQA